MCMNSLLSTSSNIQRSLFNIKTFVLCAHRMCISFKFLYNQHFKTNPSFFFFCMLLQQEILIVEYVHI